jgi:archaellum component FlaC
MTTHRYQTIYNSISTNELQVETIRGHGFLGEVKVNGNFEVEGRLIHEGGRVISDEFKELKEEIKNLKERMQEYEEDITILEKKLDEVYYAPGGPIFQEAKTSFETNKKLRN